MGIILSALIPSLLAILFIMYMDKYKPEPIKYIIWAVVAGMISVIPSLILELVLSPTFDVTPAGKAISAAV